MVITGNKITDWIKYELYPAFFDRIDHALQEHQFRRARGGWESKTYLNGSPPQGPARQDRSKHQGPRQDIGAREGKT